jgi:hypothetical protein
MTQKADSQAPAWRRRLAVWLLAGIIYTAGTLVLGRLIGHPWNLTHWLLETSAMLAAWYAGRWTAGKIGLRMTHASGKEADTPE